MRAYLAGESVVIGCVVCHAWLALGPAAVAALDMPLSAHSSHHHHHHHHH